jgi:hypothetical protein
MKKVVDAKALREKIEGLYKDVDLTQDDKKLLRNERTSLTMKENGIQPKPEAIAKAAEKKIGISRPKSVVTKISKSKTGISAEWNKAPKSEDHKLKISETLSECESYQRSENTKEKNRKAAIEKRGTRMDTPDGEFLARSEAAKHYAPIWGISERTASIKILGYLRDSNNKEWTYKGK